MVLTILDVSSLAAVISAMERVKPSMAEFASPMTRLASRMSVSAWAAWSALRLVMEDISSSDEDVSSMADAWAEAPSARDRLAEETSSAEADTWPDASPICSTALRRGPEMLRANKTNPEITAMRKTAPTMTMKLRTVWTAPIRSLYSWVTATFQRASGAGA